MDVPLIVMVTEEQKGLIKNAANAAGSDMSAWIRPILLKAARQEMLSTKGQKIPKTAK
ncbi:MAG: hypothetical protein NTX52_08790 [Planctomycetota bacterium]|nr:hypothetical protein [Planctomycetota bacterium]